MGPSIQGGGCSASGEPPAVGAVESALGILAVALLVMGLRRRGARVQPERPSLAPSDVNPKGRKQRFADTRGRTSLRIPYVDLGRESFASVPDDR